MRGDIYLADLNPSRGSEQAGIRPVIIVQHNNIDRFTRTVVVIPLTTNLRRAQIPGTIVIPAGEGGLNQESVALCYQIVVIDRQRLQQQLGTLLSNYLQQLGDATRYTLDRCYLMPVRVKGILGAIPRKNDAFSQREHISFS